MALSVLTPGATEPVTLAEMKAHLRVDHSDEDGLIGDLIADARAEAEAATGLTLRESTLRLTLDRFPPVVRLPVWPVRGIDQVAYDDADGVEQVLASDRWTWVRSRSPNLVAPAEGDSWPVPRLHWDAVRIDIDAGWAPDDVPRDIRRAILLIAGRHYAFREDVTAGAAPAPLPEPARALLARHAFRI